MAFRVRPVSLIEDTSRETAAAFMKMNEYVDVLIPRGGAGLIRARRQSGDDSCD